MEDKTLEEFRMILDEIATNDPIKFEGKLEVSDSKWGEYAKFFIVNEDGKNLVLSSLPVDGSYVLKPASIHIGDGCEYVGFMATKISDE